MKLKEKLQLLRDALGLDLIEREIPLRLVLLAALAGEHLLLIGPPGTAKSELARRLKLALNGSHYFERLLTRFSVPEELFGPLSIKGLEQDRYERLTSRYLPDATVAFIDEIFKANSAILNALLTLLNEREFDNGHERQKTPLVSVVGASNELPEGEELDALYDRFLLRYHVDPVSSQGFDALLKLRGQTKPKPDLKLRLTSDDLKEIQENAELVEVPEDVTELLKALRTFLQEQKIAVSDRRWRKIVKLLQVSAYTDGRNTASVWDCWLLQHCLWEKPEQRKAVYDWYERRVGTSGKFSAAEFVRLVSTWEDKLKQDETSQTQLKDKNGKPLYLDSNKKQTTDDSQRVWQKREREYLYLAPPQEKDRSNGNKGYTKEELYSTFQSRGGYQNNAILVGNKTQSINDYIANEANRFLLQEKLHAAMEPTRYSADHIQGRLNGTGGLLENITAYLQGIDTQLQSLGETIDSHLWIAPGFSAPARENLQRTRDDVAGLKARLESVRKGFETLPREYGA